MRAVVAACLVLSQLASVACAPSFEGSQPQGAATAGSTLVALRNAATADDIVKAICSSYGLGESCFEGWDIDLDKREAEAKALLDRTGPLVSAQAALHFCQLAVGPARAGQCGDFETELILNLAKRGTAPLRAPEVSYALAAQTSQLPSSGSNQIAAGTAVAAAGLVVLVFVVLPKAMEAAKPAVDTWLNAERASKQKKRGYP